MSSYQGKKQITEMSENRIQKLHTYLKNTSRHRNKRVKYSSFLCYASMQSFGDLFTFYTWSRLRLESDLLLLVGTVVGVHGCLLSTHSIRLCQPIDNRILASLPVKVNPFFLLSGILHGILSLWKTLSNLATLGSLWLTKNFTSVWLLAVIVSNLL